MRERERDIYQHLFKYIHLYLFANDREKELLGSYFARETFINLRRAVRWRAQLQVDDKKITDLSVETWSVYTSCSRSPRNDIWEFECPSLHRHRTDRTFRWKLHQRTVKFCIPMWEAFEYPSRRRHRLGKSISTEIGSSRRPGILYRVRQKLSFGRGRHFSTHPPLPLFVILPFAKVASTYPHKQATSWSSSYIVKTYIRLVYIYIHVEEQTWNRRGKTLLMLLQKIVLTISQNWNAELEFSRFLFNVAATAIIPRDLSSILSNVHSRCAHTHERCSAARRISFPKMMTCATRDSRGKLNHIFFSSLNF